MVGKVWSDIEERYFWRTAVAHSSKRAGIDRANSEKTWDQLAYEMHRSMERHGQVRRQYTSTMLFEHYFQNIEGERRSPNAAAYVNEYLRKLGPNHEVVNPRATRPRREVKKRRARNAPPSPSPIADIAPQPKDKDRVVSTESSSLPTLREMNLPDPRPLLRPCPGLSSRRSFRPSQPLRPLVPANHRTLPPSPLASPTCDGLSYGNQQAIPSGWNMASPSTVPSHGAPSYQPRTPLTPGSANINSAGEAVWGYQMGKRSAPEQSSSSLPSKSQKTSAAGFPTRRHYPEGYEMGAEHFAEPASESPVTFPQATILGRTSNTSSINATQNLQQPRSAGYQFEGYSSPGSLSTVYSTIASESSALSQTASNQSVESTLFVEDSGHGRDDIGDGGDEDAEGSDEGIKDIDVKRDAGVHIMSYQDFCKGKFINWTGQGAGYDDVADGDYIPGTSVSF
ncbi:hypothetical protein F4781DRAFT_445505 [Annulohypoxylon bovei var. microspora]|nr:hypothetical protein F4781DRAFT_445505 [Annulohypoxylon bovei var. microspora]